MTTKHEQDKAALVAAGKCASSDGREHLCTKIANHYPQNHIMQILGGVEDGKLVAEWEW